MALLFSAWLFRPGPGLLTPLVVSFQNKNLDWFPRMRAMSLVSNEGEGEQNEIRILQDKLNSTMKLVSHLTAQLNELKEQVRAQPDPGTTLGVPPGSLPLSPRVQSSLPWGRRAEVLGPPRLFLPGPVLGSQIHTPL